MPVVDNAPISQQRQHAPVALFIEDESGAMGPDVSGLIDWDRVVWGIDGAPDTATLRIALSAKDLVSGEPTGVRHFGHLVGPGGLFRPDRRVWIQQPLGLDPPEWLFEGYPMLSAVAWSADSQSLTITCNSLAQEQLHHRYRMQSVGRWMHVNREAFLWDKDDYQNLVVSVPSMPAWFNAGGKPNRTADSYTFAAPWGDLELYLFTEDGAPGAKKWSYLDALRYQLWWDVIHPKATGDLLTFDVQAFFDDTARLVGAEPGGENVGANGFDRLGVQPVEAERADGTDVLAIVGLLVQRAGLHYQTAIKADPDGGPTGDPLHYLRVFPAVGPDDVAPESFTMGWPTAGPIPREAPFTTLTDHDGSFHAWSKANAAQNATLSLDDRVINNPLYLGGVRRHEVTLYLIPGWIPFDLAHYASDYSGLVVVPERNMLDNITDVVDWDDANDEAAVAIKKYWWDNRIPTREEDGSLTIHSQFDRRHAQHSVVADVGRKWIFPTGPRYGSAESDNPTDSPYWRTYGASPNEYISASPERMTYNAFSAFGGGGEVNRLIHAQYGGGIASATDWAARERLFQSPIARFPRGSRLAPYIEIKVGGNPFDATTGWAHYTAGSPAVSQTESAILVSIENAAEISTADGEPDLDLNWWRWIAQQVLFMRITCTIDSDQRMFYRVPNGNPELMQRDRSSVIDLGEQYQFRDRRNTNSKFKDQLPNPDTDETYESIDESEKLRKYAEAEAVKLRQQAVSGDPEIPWISFDRVPGDTFSGCPGVGLEEFNTQPEIVSVSFENREQGGYRTKYMSRDLRHDPTLLLDE